MNDEVITIKTTRSQVWRVVVMMLADMNTNDPMLDAKAVAMLQEKDELFAAHPEHFHSLGLEERKEYSSRILTDLAIEFLRVGEQ